jgi:hypothetical protein
MHLSHSSRTGQEGHCLGYQSAAMSFDQNPKVEAVLASEEFGDEVYAPQKPVSRFTRWYRSPLFNVILIGLISFSQQGIWNALNSMEAPAAIQRDKNDEADED